MGLLNIINRAIESQNGGDKTVATGPAVQSVVQPPQQYLLKRTLKRRQQFHLIGKYQTLPGKLQSHPSNYSWIPIPWVEKPKR
jgi:hypothetical protein